MKRLSISLLATAAFAMVPLAAAAADLYNNTNTDAVSNAPTGKSAFGLTCNAHITQIETYHWNGGRGATPGTISLQSNQTGKVYGPFGAQGSSGSNNAPNVNWTANVSLDLPGGKGLTGLATFGYIVIDSDNKTWSMNAKSAYRGFVIVRGACGSAVATAAPGGPPVPITKGPPVLKPTLAPAKPTAKPIAKVTPKPTPTPTSPLANIKPCFVNTGAIASTGPCFGPPGSAIAVRIYNQNFGPYTALQFKTVATAGVPALVETPLSGSGSLMSASAPVKLCVAPSPTKWQVWIINKTKSLGEIGEFTITGCSSVGPSGLPTPVPGTPPPGLSAVKPCYVNTGAIASSGPCSGKPGSQLAMRIYSQKYGPYTIVVFKTVVTSGVPAAVTSPLVGSGSLVSVTVPAQLCVAKNTKWQVWLSNQTKSVGQIGDFTIVGCP
jgi:hypothetical protein